MTTIAFVFPGQGSQSIGMMAGWDGHPAVRASFAEASDALGQDLWALVTDGPAEALNLTTNTQPVMLTAGVAAWRTRAFRIARSRVSARTDFSSGVPARASPRERSRRDSSSIRAARSIRSARAT